MMARAEQVGVGFVATLSLVAPLSVVRANGSWADWRPAADTALLQRALSARGRRDTCDDRSRRYTRSDAGAAKDGVVVSGGVI